MKLKSKHQCMLFTVDIQSKNNFLGPWYQVDHDDVIVVFAGYGIVEFVKNTANSKLVTSDDDFTDQFTGR